MSARSNWPLFLLPFTLLLSTLSCALETRAADAPEFRWLEPKSDARLWKKIETAFAEELKPDAAASNASRAPILQKSISRVGLHDKSAFVLLAIPEEERGRKETSFQAYNYNLDSEQVELIPCPLAGGVWQWHLVRLARFESTPAPDIVFQLVDCVQCEAQKLLASFRFDLPRKQWRWRNWEMSASPHSGWTLLIGGDPEPGFDPDEAERTEYLYQTSCALRIADLNDDGLDDVATWCREKATTMDSPKKVHAVKDTTLFFTAENGTPELQKIKDQAAASRLQHQICSIQPQTPPCNALPASK